MYLGVVFDLTNYEHYAASIRVHAKLFNKKSFLISLIDVSLLDELITIEKENHSFQRVIVYDFSEFQGIENFKTFAKTCYKHGLEFSILKQDLHSCVPVELGYFLDVI